MNIRQYTSIADRRNALEKMTGTSFSHIGSYSLDEKTASSRHCENMIGVTQVPMGVAGPLYITHVSGNTGHEYYIPLSTTEGALVASVNRGCKAITECGGAVTDSHAVGATRGPVFRVKNLQESRRLYEYVKTHKRALEEVASKTSHHLTLHNILTRGVGRYRYIRFVFDTQDAMGMNMVTIASEAIAAYIERETGIACLAVAGNFDIDKKPAWLNFIENRGTKAWAEVTIPKHILKNVLKTTARDIYDVWLAKCMIGSAMSGSMGFNAQYANIVAAMFLATGQDLGHIGEGSMGITTAEVVDNHDLYISVYLPDLMVGTVGGGTALATQEEALRLLGIAGGKDGSHAAVFAEIIGAAVLAGEISLLASLSQGTLAKAHEVLARGGKRP